jgi:hypothetical protein
VAAAHCSDRRALLRPPRTPAAAAHFCGRLVLLRPPRTSVAAPQPPTVIKLLDLLGVFFRAVASLRLPR